MFEKNNSINLFGMKITWRRMKQVFTTIFIILLCSQLSTVFNFTVYRQRINESPQKLQEIRNEYFTNLENELNELFTGLNYSCYEKYSSYEGSGMLLFDIYQDDFIFKGRSYYGPDQSLEIKENFVRIGRLVQYNNYKEFKTGSIVCNGTHIAYTIKVIRNGKEITIIDRNKGFQSMAYFEFLLVQNAHNRYLSEEELEAMSKYPNDHVKKFEAVLGEAAQEPSKENLERVAQRFNNYARKKGLYEIYSAHVIKNKESIGYQLVIGRFETETKKGLTSRSFVENINVDLYDEEFSFTYGYAPVRGLYQSMSTNDFFICLDDLSLDIRERNYDQINSRLLQRCSFIITDDYSSITSWSSDGSINTPTIDDWDESVLSVAVVSQYSKRDSGLPKLLESIIEENIYGVLDFYTFGEVNGDSWKNVLLTIDEYGECLLDRYSMLFIDDYSVSSWRSDYDLTPRQKQCLAIWVQRGGQLYLSSALSNQETIVKDRIFPGEFLETMMKNALVNGDFEIDWTDDNDRMFEIDTGNYVNSVWNKAITHDNDVWYWDVNSGTGERQQDNGYFEIWSSSPNGKAEIYADTQSVDFEIDLEEKFYYEVLVAPNIPVGTTNDEYGFTFCVNIDDYILDHYAKIQYYNGELWAGIDDRTEIESNWGFWTDPPTQEIFEWENNEWHALRIVINREENIDNRYIQFLVDGDIYRDEGDTTYLDHDDEYNSHILVQNLQATTNNKLKIDYFETGFLDEGLNGMWNFFSDTPKSSHYTSDLDAQGEYAYSYGLDGIHANSLRIGIKHEFEDTFRYLYDECSPDYSVNITQEFTVPEAYTNAYLYFDYRALVEPDYRYLDIILLNSENDVVYMETVTNSNPETPYPIDEWENSGRIDITKYVRKYSGENLYCVIRVWADTTKITENNYPDTTSYGDFLVDNLSVFFLGGKSTQIIIHYDREVLENIEIDTLGGWQNPDSYDISHPYYYIEPMNSRFLANQLLQELAAEGLFNVQIMDSNELLDFLDFDLPAIIINTQPFIEEIFDGSSSSKIITWCKTSGGALIDTMIEPLTYYLVENMGNKYDLVRCEQSDVALLGYDLFKSVIDIGNGPQIALYSENFDDVQSNIVNINDDEVEFKLTDFIGGYLEIMAARSENSNIWSNYEFEFRKPLTITNNGLENLQNYPLAIDLTNTVYNYNDLISSWHFNDEIGQIASDSSGEGQDCNLFGVSWSEGVEESSLEFDGLYDYTEIPSVYSEILDDDFTISLWFNIFGPNSDDRTYQELIDLRGEKQIWFEFIEGGKIEFKVNDGVSTKVLQSISNGEYNKWYHAILWRDDNSLKLSLNNQEQDTETLDAQIASTSSGSNRLGSLYSLEDAGSGFRGTVNGLIDEVRIYSRAILIDEISEQFAIGAKQLVDSGKISLITYDNYNCDSYLKSQSYSWNDLRFGYQTYNLLNYWVENDKKVWLKIPNLLPEDYITFYMYYGNSYAESLSNGEKVFEFFDDFSSSSLDLDKWTITSDPWSLSNGYLEIEPTADSNYLTTLNGYNDYGLIIESRIKSESNGDASAHPGIFWHSDYDNNDQVFFRPYGYGESMLYSTSFEEGPPISNGWVNVVADSGTIFVQDSTYKQSGTYSGHHDGGSRSAWRLDKWVDGDTHTDCTLTGWVYNNHNNYFSSSYIYPIFVDGNNYIALRLYKNKAIIYSMINGVGTNTETPIENWNQKWWEFSITVSGNQAFGWLKTGGNTYDLNSHSWSGAIPNGYIALNSRVGRYDDYWYDDLELVINSPDNIQPAYYDGSITQHSGAGGEFFDWSKWYTMKVELINNADIKLYGNNELWYNYASQQYSSERMGLLAHADGKNFFDWFRIRTYTPQEPIIEFGLEEKHFKYSFGSEIAETNGGVSISEGDYFHFDVYLEGSLRANIYGTNGEGEDVSLSIILGENNNDIFANEENYHQYCIPFNSAINPSDLEAGQWHSILIDPFMIGAFLEDDFENFEKITSIQFITKSNTTLLDNIWIGKSATITSFSNNKGWFIEPLSVFSSDYPISLSILEEMRLNLPDFEYQVFGSSISTRKLSINEDFNEIGYPTLDQWCELPFNNWDFKGYEITNSTAISLAGLDSLWWNVTGVHSIELGTGNVDISRYNNLVLSIQSNISISNWYGVDNYPTINLIDINGASISYFMDSPFIANDWSTCVFNLEEPDLSSPVFDYDHLAQISIYIPKPTEIEGISIYIDNLHFESSIDKDRWDFSELVYVMNEMCFINATKTDPLYIKAEELFGLGEIEFLLALEENVDVKFGLFSEQDTSGVYFHYKSIESERWWNDDWNYRQGFKITNLQNYDLINYQVKVPLDDFDINRLSDSSLGTDIRFADDSPLPMPLSFWKEDMLMPSCDFIWVNLPYLKANSESMIYMYYNNPDVVGYDYSDGFNTFEFFDDFNDNSINEDFWTLVGTGLREEVNQQLHLKTSVSWGAAGIQTTSAIDIDNTIIEYDVKLVGTGSQAGEFIALEADGTTGIYMVFFDYPTNRLSLFSKYQDNWALRWQASASFSLNTWYIIKLIDTGSSITVSWLNEFNIEIENSGSHDYDPETGPIRLSEGTTNDESYRDNFKIRKYSAIEPIVVQYYEEETPLSVMSTTTNNHIDELNLDEFLSTFDKTFNNPIEEPQTDWLTKSLGFDSPESLLATPNDYGDPWWDTDWRYRKEIVISNPSSAITNYQIKVDLTNIYSYHGLVGSWHLDEYEDCPIADRIYDSSGTGHDDGDCGEFWGTGVEGSSKYFNGFSSYAIIPDSESFDFNTPASYTFWMKRTGSGSTGDVDTIMAKRNEFWIQINRDFNKLVFESAGAGGVWSPDAYSSSSIPLNEWTHCVITRDTGSNNIRFYINGVFDGEDNTYSPSLDSAPLYFGGWEGTNHNYKGYLDEVRIYNRVLTNDDISELFVVGANQLLEAGELTQQEYDNYDVDSYLKSESYRWKDLRFTDTDGNSLDYWIQDDTTAWVDVNSIQPSGDTIVYMYYGNHVASSESDGYSTFPFFDDFSNPMMTYYNYPGGSSYMETTADSELHIHAESDYGPMDGNAGYYFDSPSLNLNDFIVHGETRWLNLDYERGAGLFDMVGMVDGDGYRSGFALALYGDYKLVRYRYEDGTQVESVYNYNVPDSSSGTATFDYYVTGSTFNMYIDGTYPRGVSSTISGFNKNGWKVRLYTYVDYWTDYVQVSTFYDLIYVRKYTTNPPTHIQDSEECVDYVGWEPNDWWNTDWDYRRKIDIDYPTGEPDIEDYQIKLILDDNNFDYSKLSNINGNDIRFISTQEPNKQLDYWIETWKVGSEHLSIIWIEVDDIFAGANNYIWLYYNNPSAVSKTNGDSTFEFFDGFDDTSLDLTKWNIITQSSGSTITIADGIMKLYRPSGGNTIDLRTDQTFGNNKIIQYKQYLRPQYTDKYYHSSFYYGRPSESRSSIGYSVYWLYESALYTGTSTYPPRCGGSTSTLGDIITNPPQFTWFTESFYIPSGDYLKRVMDDTTTETSTRYTGVTYSDNNLGIYTRSPSSYWVEQWIDYVYIRNLIDYEPGITVGTEIENIPPEVFNVNYCTSIEKTQLQLNWDDSLYAEEYEIQVIGDFWSVWTTLTTVDSSNTDHLITGLTEGTTYDFRIKAINSVDETDWMELVGDVTTVPIDPIISVINEGSTSFYMEWSDCPGFDQYEISISTDGVSWQQETQTTDTFGAFSNLDSNTEYYVRVFASVTHGGVNYYSNPEITTHWTGSEAPIIDTATVLYEDRLELTWSAPTDAQSYQVYIDGNLEYEGTDAFFTFFSVTQGYYYSCEVIAINSHGSISDYSVIDLRPALSEGAPQLDLFITDYNQLYVQYHTQQTPCDGWAIWIKKDGEDYTTDPDRISPFPPELYTSLDPSTIYVIKVSSYVIYKGQNIYSTSIENDITTWDVIPPELSECTQITDSSLRINWESIANAEQYQIFMDGSAIGYSTNNFFDVSNLKSGHVYTFQVKVQINGGWSGLSYPLSITTEYVANGLYAVVSDGTTVQRIRIDDTTFDPTIPHLYKIIRLLDCIEFYIDDLLVATITDNLPVFDSQNLEHYVAVNVFDGTAIIDSIKTTEDVIIVDEQAFDYYELQGDIFVDPVAISFEDGWLGFVKNTPVKPMTLYYATEARTAVDWITTMIVEYLINKIPENFDFYWKMITGTTADFYALSDYAHKIVQYPRNVVNPNAYFESVIPSQSIRQINPNLITSQQFMIPSFNDLQLYGLSPEGYIQNWLVNQYKNEGLDYPYPNNYITDYEEEMTVNNILFSTDFDSEHWSFMDDWQYVDFGAEDWIESASGLVYDDYLSKNVLRLDEDSILLDPYIESCSDDAIESGEDLFHYLLSETWYENATNLIGIVGGLHYGYGYPTPSLYMTNPNSDPMIGCFGSTFDYEDVPSAQYYVLEFDYSVTYAETLPITITVELIEPNDPANNDEKPLDYTDYLDNYHVVGSVYEFTTTMTEEEDMRHVIYDGFSSSIYQQAITFGEIHNAYLNIKVTYNGEGNQTIYFDNIRLTPTNDIDGVAGTTEFGNGYGLKVDFGNLHYYQGTNFDKLEDPKVIKYPFIQLTDVLTTDNPLTGGKYQFNIKLYDKTNDKDLWLHFFWGNEEQTIGGYQDREVYTELDGTKHFYLKRPEVLSCIGQDIQIDLMYILGEFIKESLTYVDRNNLLHTLDMEVLLEDATQLQISDLQVSGFDEWADITLSSPYTLDLKDIYGNLIGGSDVTLLANTFLLSEKESVANAVIECANDWSLYVNGYLVNQSTYFTDSGPYEVMIHLLPGINTLGVVAPNKIENDQSGTSIKIKLLKPETDDPIDFVDIISMLQESSEHPMVRANIGAGTITFVSWEWDENNFGHEQMLTNILINTHENLQLQLSSVLREYLNLVDRNLLYKYNNLEYDWFNDDNPFPGVGTDTLMWLMEDILKFVNIQFHKSLSGTQKKTTFPNGEYMDYEEAQNVKNILEDLLGSFTGNAAGFYPNDGLVFELPSEGDTTYKEQNIMFPDLDKAQCWGTAEYWNIIIPGIQIENTHSFGVITGHVEENAGYYTVIIDVKIMIRQRFKDFAWMEPWPHPDYSLGKFRIYNDQKVELVGSDAEIITGWDKWGVFYTNPIFETLREQSEGPLTLIETIDLITEIIQRQDWDVLCPETRSETGLLSWLVDDALDALVDKDAKPWKWHLGAYLKNYIDTIKLKMYEAGRESCMNFLQTQDERIAQMYGLYDYDVDYSTESLDNVRPGRNYTINMAVPVTPPVQIGSLNSYFSGLNWFWFFNQRYEGFDTPYLLKNNPHGIRSALSTTLINEYTKYRTLFSTASGYDSSITSTYLLSRSALFFIEDAIAQFLNQDNAINKVSTSDPIHYHRNNFVLVIVNKAVFENGLLITPPKYALVDLSDKNELIDSDITKSAIQVGITRDSYLRIEIDEHNGLRPIFQDVYLFDPEIFEITMQKAYDLPRSQINPLANGFPEITQEDILWEQQIKINGMTYNGQFFQLKTWGLDEKVLPADFLVCKYWDPEFQVYRYFISHTLINNAHNRLGINIEHSEGLTTQEYRVKGLVEMATYVPIGTTGTPQQKAIASLESLWEIPQEFVILGDDGESRFNALVEMGLVPLIGGQKPTGEHTGKQTVIWVDRNTVLSALTPPSTNRNEKTEHAIKLEYKNGQTWEIGADISWKEITEMDTILINDYHNLEVHSTISDQIMGDGDYYKRHGEFGLTVTYTPYGQQISMKNDLLLQYYLAKQTRLRSKNGLKDTTRERLLTLTAIYIGRILISYYLNSINERFGLSNDIKIDHETGEVVQNTQKTWRFRRHLKELSKKGILGSLIESQSELIDLAEELLAQAYDDGVFDHLVSSFKPEFRKNPDTGLLWATGDAAELYRLWVIIDDLFVRSGMSSENDLFSPKEKKIIKNGFTLLAHRKLADITDSAFKTREELMNSRDENNNGILPRINGLQMLLLFYWELNTVFEDQYGYLRRNLDTPHQDLYLFMKTMMQVSGSYMGLHWISDMDKNENYRPYIYILKAIMGMAIHMGSDQIDLRDFTDDVFYRLNNPENIQGSKYIPLPTWKEMTKYVLQLRAVSPNVASVIMQNLESLVKLAAIAELTNNPLFYEINDIIEEYGIEEAVLRMVDPSTADPVYIFWLPTRTSNGVDLRDWIDTMPDLSSDEYRTLNYFDLLFQLKNIDGGIYTQPRFQDIKDVGGSVSKFIKLLGMTRTTSVNTNQEHAIKYFQQLYYSYFGKQITDSNDLETSVSLADLLQKQVIFVEFDERIGAERFYQEQYMQIHEWIGPNPDDTQPLMTDGKPVYRKIRIYLDNADEITTHDLNDKTSIENMMNEIYIENQQNTKRIHLVKGKRGTIQIMMAKCPKTKSDINVIHAQSTDSKYTRIQIEEDPERCRDLIDDFVETAQTISGGESLNADSVRNLGTDMFNDVVLRIRSMMKRHLNIRAQNDPYNQDILPSDGMMKEAINPFKRKYTIYKSMVLPIYWIYSIMPGRTKTNLNDIISIYRVAKDFVVHTSAIFVLTTDLLTHGLLQNTRAHSWALQRMVERIDIAFNKMATYFNRVTGSYFFGINPLSWYSTNSKLMRSWYFISATMQTSAVGLYQGFNNFVNGMPRQFGMQLMIAPLIEFAMLSAYLHTFVKNTESINPDGNDLEQRGEIVSTYSCDRKAQTILSAAQIDKNNLTRHRDGLWFAVWSWATDYFEFFGEMWEIVNGIATGRMLARIDAGMKPVNNGRAPVDVNDPLTMVRCTKGILQLNEVPLPPGFENEYDWVRSPTFDVLYKALLTFLAATISVVTEVAEQGLNIIFTGGLAGLASSMVAGFIVQTLYENYYSNAGTATWVKNWNYYYMGTISYEGDIGIKRGVPLWLQGFLGGFIDTFGILGDGATRDEIILIGVISGLVFIAGILLMFACPYAIGIILICELVVLAIFMCTILKWKCGDIIIEVIGDPQ